MRVQRVLMPDGSESWTVLGPAGEPVGPVEAFLAHLQALDRRPGRDRNRMLVNGFRAGTVRVVPPRHDPQLPSVGHEVVVPQPQRLPNSHACLREQNK